MEKAVFDFQNYVSYLTYHEEKGPLAGRGFRSKIAAALGSQRAHISQIFSNKIHISLEHADKINQFLSHSREEAWFFLLLVQFSRSGTEELRNEFRRQIETILSSRMNLAKRLKSDRELSLEEKVRFTSSWTYLPILMAPSIPHLRSIEAIAKHLNLSTDLVKEIVNYLIERKFLKLNGSTILPGASNIHFGRDPVLGNRSHANWRVKIIGKLENVKPEDLHISMVYTLSKEDGMALKALIVNFINSLQPTIQKSKDEVLYSFCLDFFEL